MQSSQIYIQALLLIITLVTILWIVSVFLKNVSIVDIFWGFGFVITAVFYFFRNEEYDARNILVLILTTIWGLRLSIYLAWRNLGKGEDFRYQQFRNKYGADRYWWISYFQVFLLQGILMWLISAPLLGSMFSSKSNFPGIFDFVGLILWIIGFVFEAGGDFQLAAFKKNPTNKGKILDRGFWKYTRHPNYFGDSSVWWGFACFSIAAVHYINVLGSILMTLLIIKVSGVALLEKSLENTKPEYKEYIRKTSPFIPWMPKKTGNK